MGGPTLLRLALRDLKGGLRRLWVVLACLTLGVGLIAGVGGINGALVEALNRDAAKLLGGDLALEVSNAPVPDAVLDQAVPEGGALSRTLRTNSIAFAPEGRNAPVEIKAVDEAYPLTGTLRLDPPLPLGEVLATNRAAVDPLLLARLGIEVGDTIQIGQSQIEVAAAVVEEPDKLVSFVGTGPRVLVSTATLEGMGILLPGALVRYSDRILLPEGADPVAEAARIEAIDPDGSYQVRPASAVQPRIERLTNRLAAWLTLAGLASLLIGGLGVGLAVRAWLDDKTVMIATLKAMGARNRDIDKLLGLEVGLLALIGIGLGLLVGALLPQIARLLPEALLPVALAPGVYVAPLALAAFIGLLTTALFTLLPLAEARGVPPARLFRDASLGEHEGGLRKALVPLLATGAVLALTIVLAMPDAELGLGFLGASLALALALLGFGRLVLARLPALAPLAPAPLRPAVRRLARPGSGALTVTSALAAGLAALTIVTLVDATLREEIVGDLPEKVPGIVFIDIQASQREAFEAEVAEAGVEVLQVTPLLRGRVVRINGEVPNPEEIGRGGRWTLRSDRGLTWKGPLPEGAEIVAGEWWPEDYDGPPLVSVEDEVAYAYGVGVGDTLSFNVLGRVIEAEIASLRREIDWSEGRIDFIFIFSPGVVDQAPHTLVAAVDVPPEGEAPLMRAMGEALPNVTPIAVGEVVRRLGQIMEQAGTALRAVAGITLLSGGFVLAAAVAAARRRQAREAVLLKVIGATRGQILAQMLTELALLGLVAGVIGLGLGTLGAYLITWLALDLALVMSPLGVLVILVLSLALTLLIGGLGLRGVLSVPAARALRTT